MRITETHLTALAGRGLSRGMSSFAKAARQLQTGVAVEKPSHDPAAWAAAQRIRSRAAIADAHGQAIATSRDRLTEAEGALASVGDSLSRARELVTQLAQGQLGEATRSTGVAELRDLHAQILADLDRRASDGEPLFGYLVDTGVIGGDVAASIDALAQLADAVEAGDVAAVRALIDPITRAHERAVDARALIGHHINALDSAQSARLAMSDAMVAELERLVGADPIDAASALARAQLAVEGARQVAGAIAQTLRSST